jgi:hypothetical protein
VSAQRRKMPSCAAIWTYWAALGFEGSRFTCMGCGRRSDGHNLDRAHVKARCDGGPDAVYNLVLVCGECHVRTDGWTIECWELKVLGGPRYAPLFDRLLGSAESRAILQSQRTRDALKAAKARGTTRTGALFTIGNPRIEEARKAAARAVQNQADRFAANVAPLIEPLRKQGMSLAAIAGALEARGVKSARGQRWHAAQVADVLRRAA